MSKRTISYCGIPIEYTLTRKPVKNVNIRINEEGRIMVSAAKAVSTGYINEFVESKAEWIIRNLAAIERYNRVKPDNEVYIGKRVYYLGELCVIDVETSKEERVEKEDNVITIYTSDGENGSVLKGLYLRWLYDRAQEAFKDSMERMYLLAEKEGIPKADMAVRNMKTRWGTCNVKTKKITLNLQLIKTDIKCIDQVVLHEYMHFKYINHNSDFYSLLDRYMSNWREYKKDLEERYKDGI